MRKTLLFLFLAVIVVNTNQAQTKGTKIGYIDMEYILQNVPDYTEAQNQLELKAEKWKQEIESKKIEINKLKEALKAEKALLTKSLIEERETEITFLENESLDYQQKRFGPNGDLMTQKIVLIKPIQDQVFTIVQDIATTKKYDFIFDKSSDLTMLFASKKYDINDLVLRVLNRTEKREQLTKKQQAIEDAKEAKEDALDENPVLADRKKALDEKKITRDQIIADRKLAQEEKKKGFDERRQQLLADKEAKKNGAVSSNTKVTDSKIPAVDETKAEQQAEAKQNLIDQRAKILEDRKKVIEDRKKDLEERRIKALEERNAKKTGAASTTDTKPEETKEPLANATKASQLAESKQKAIDQKAKTIEDRNKVIETRKKEIEEKRKQILEERVSKKSGTVSESPKKVDTTLIVKDSVKVPTKSLAEIAKQKQIDARNKALEDRKKIIEDRKKLLEEKRLKILEDKEALKKAKEEKIKNN
ncbi:OmpH family outer membrane protein [Flavobacterium sp.]|uniref:OmpH family outer membrane protein n=1 Tax=Flavobacterium sp. TaxID=239 RepID=UPI00286B20EC|nr:OmpH family outer membrane protein [Flavobacterium sp.]